MNRLGPPPIRFANRKFHYGRVLHGHNDVHPKRRKAGLKLVARRVEHDRLLATLAAVCDRGVTVDSATIAAALSETPPRTRSSTVTA
jgi:hypothetical protein